MMLGGNPTGHGFVLRDLVLIELSECTPIQLGGEGEGGGLKFQKKSCLGQGQKF